VTRSQDSRTTPEQATAGDVSAGSPSPLPPLADWLTGVNELPAGKRRAAVRAALPALAEQPNRVRRDWVAAIVAAKIYGSAGYLTRQLGEHRDPADTGDQAGADGGTDRVPGSRWTYTPGVGVWDQGGHRLLDWCPAVSGNLVSYRDDGRVAGQQVTITVHPYTATVPMSEVENGAVWWDGFPNAVGTADRKVRDQLTNIVRREAGKLPDVVAHPRWNNGRLELPPADCLPAGYLERGGSWREWCHLVQRSMDTPKIALVMSLAVAGLYVKPLALQSYVVHLMGPSSRGKSTAAVMTAGIFGDPADNRVVTGWDVSAKGLPAWLRSLRLLTGIRDELGAAGFRASELQEVIFRITQGAERHVSSRAGMYRAPATGWHGCLVSTGNLSILGQIDNEAAYARVIEIGTPFTDNHAQAKAFKDMAREHYGHGLPAIAERALSPKEWALWLRKAELDLAIPEGDVLGRAGAHLAGGLAGARLISEICGINGYHEPVFTAARAALAVLAEELASNGATPDIRLRLAIADMAARNPSVFPSESEYECAILGDFRMPDIYGWDRTGSDKPGDYAILSSGIKAIARDYKITDLTVALKGLNQNGLLVRNERSPDYAAQVWVAGKNRRAYIVRGVLDAVTGDQADQTGTDDQAALATAPSDCPSDSSNDTKTGFDLRPSDSSDISRGKVCVRDLVSLSDDALAGLVNADTDEPTLDAVLAELDRRSLAPESHGDGRTGAPEGRHTHGGGSRQGGAQPADPAEWANWGRWLDRAEIEVSEEAARRALAGWHQATRGLWWAEYPGRTGINAYKRLQSRHPNMPQVERCDSELVDSITTGGGLVLLLDYVDTSQVPELGQKITSVDVTAQFLASAAAVELGDGEPQVIDRPRGIESLFKLPGYVELSESLDTDHPAFAGRDVAAGAWLPMPLARYLHEWETPVHVARVVVWTDKGQRLKRHAGELREARDWLMQWDGEPARIALQAVKAVYAGTYGGMLRSDKYNPEYVRRDWSDQLVSLAWCNAFRALDRVAYGVALDRPDGKRSIYRDVLDARNSGAPRGCAPLGICKDTAYFLNDSTEPFEPLGLEISRHKPGKWKVEKHVAVTEDIIHACERGSAYLLRDSVNAAWKEDGQ
jgi:hypothetical protein